MIDASSFVAVVKAASLKGLETLGRACAYFGSTDEQVQAMLQKGSLPVADRRPLGEPVDHCRCLRLAARHEEAKGFLLFMRTARSSSVKPLDAYR